MTVPITFTLIGGGEDLAMPTKSLTVTSGTLMPVAVARWAEDARAFILSTPPNTVTVPEPLLAAVREAEGAHASTRREDDEGAVTHSAESSEALDAALLALGRAVAEAIK